MSASSYDELARNIIKDFIKTVVLIDDHWADAQNIPMLQLEDANVINFVPPTILAQEPIDPASLNREHHVSTSEVGSMAPDYLRQIGQAIANQGYLFTGYQYTDQKKENVLKLALKADILILDWNLGLVDSGPALELLKKLKSSGSPRFIFILTDQPLNSVRKKIAQELGVITNSFGFIFSCGPFSFSLKNKPQTRGKNTVRPEEILGEAINGIYVQFGGLLQLAALQLLSSYKAKLHEVLTHFRVDLDAPFIAEWLEKDSPIGPNNCFRSLMIDEWRSFVEKNNSTSTSPILTNEGIAAFLASKKAALKWGGESASKAHSRVPKDIQNILPLSGAKLDALESELKDWLENGDRTVWPKLKSPKGGDLKQEFSKRIVWEYISIACKNNREYREQLVNLDAFFHSQSLVPSRLTQGTVLKRKTGDEYLICTTPTCDCERPSDRIDFKYSFLLAKKIGSQDEIKSDPSAVVAVRTTESQSFLLRVILKPTLSFQVKNAELASELKLFNPFNSKQAFCAKPIGQLRPSRVQSLVALAAGKSIEIGLDRSEILRQLCKY